MSKIISLVIVTILSLIFLFTATETSFLGSEVFFYLVSGASLVILFIFSFFYFPIFSSSLSYQINSMRNKPYLSWYGRFAKNISEFTSITLMGIPYLLTLLCISKGLSLWFPHVSIIQTISFVFVMCVCMFLVFLLITTIYHSFASKRKGYNL